jgi:SAM-dependent MidA family methyltransferase
MKMPDAVIREEIQQKGPISFARFMELALYCPETGYYEANKDTVGRGGDFVTSVSVGSLFGELLAFQFAEWLKAGAGERESGSGKAARATGNTPGEEFTIVEAGAHDGQLAGDILAWLQIHRAELFAQLAYVIIEPSLRRREWQRETLKSFAPHVRWISGIASSAHLPCGRVLAPTGGDGSTASADGPIKGVIFSNELLDAFPVRRFGWDAGKKVWFEWEVALQEAKFVWARGADTWPANSVPKRPLAGGSPAPRWPASLRDLPPSLLDVLPDGYVVESCPAAAQWWGETAGTLAQGKLLTIDYGYSAEGLVSPARPHGTLRTYHRHQVADDLLANPGGQDLTAHVNFTAIQTAGEAAGLRTEQLCTQPQFLTRILQKAIAERSFAHLSAKQVRQFQTLTHPEHLGRSFRVLVQGR